MVSKEITKKFKQVVLEEYGKEISDNEASQILTELVGYFDLLAQIYHRTKVENISRTKGN